jgi:hypothetical protein
MKKIISIGIISLVLFGMFGASCVLGEKARTFPESGMIDLNSDELDQSQTVFTNGTELPVGRAPIPGFTITVLVAQSFVPTKEVLTRVELLVEKNATTTYPFSVGIRDNLTHTNLVETNVGPGNIVTGTLTWVEFNFEDLWVNPGDTYYIVGATKNATDNYYGWAGNNHSDSYLNGVAYLSIDNGSSWHQSLSAMQQNMNPSPHNVRPLNADNGTIDMCFKTYGLKKTILNLTVTSTFLRPTIAIKNTGEATAQNITWQVSVRGGIFNKINNTFNGTQTELIPADEILVRFGMIIGFGPIVVTMSASALNGKEVTITINGFVFLFFIILQK